MSKTNYLLCPGDACPLRMTCQRYQALLNSDDDDAPEMMPDYNEGECWGFQPKEYYGG